MCARRRRICWEAGGIRTPARTLRRWRTCRCRGCPQGKTHPHSAPPGPDLLRHGPCCGGAPRQSMMSAAGVVSAGQAGQPLGRRGCPGKEQRRRFPARSAGGAGGGRRNKAGGRFSDQGRRHLLPYQHGCHALLRDKKMNKCGGGGHLLSRAGQATSDST